MLGAPIGSAPLATSPTDTTTLFEKSATILLMAQIVSVASKITDGSLINVVLPPWLEIAQRLKSDPNFLQEFSRHPAKFEEFIAATYDRAGWDEVILTPRSGDRGRDVIATKRGFGSVRFLEQTKAYKVGHLVNHDDVRAMLGVLSSDQNASKALITTTSDFAPGIKNSDEFKKHMPHRLELRNGVQLIEWLNDIERLTVRT